MAESIKVFENSLKDYLVNVHADSYNTARKIVYKYNNLKVYMEPKKLHKPHFHVSLGISAACFLLENLEVVSGSLGTEERYVKMWAMRPNINSELKKQWVYLTQSNMIITEELSGGNENNNKEGKKENSDQQEHQPIQERELADYITGTGLKSNRLKNNRQTKTIEDDNK